MEKKFRDLDAAKAQAEAATSAAEKNKVDSQAKVSEQEKKTKDLEKKVKDLDAAKAKAEAAVSATEKAMAESQAKVSELDKKSKDLEKKFRDLDAAKAQADAAANAAEKAKGESDRKAVDALTKASAAEKKAVDLAAQLQSASSNLPQQTKALQEAQQENDFLLKQLQHVQEELESYHVKNKEAETQRNQLQERLDRVLMRLSTWADAGHITATEVVNEKTHRCLRLELKSLWVGQDALVDSLVFLLGSRDGVPYMEFRPGKGAVARNLLPWPDEFKDEQGDRLLIAPGAPGAYGRTQAQVVSGLSASQWRMVKGLLVLIGSQVNRLNLPEQADRLFWANITRDLTQTLDNISSGMHFQSVEVMAVTKPDAVTEVLRVAIRDLSSRSIRVPLCVVELGIKYKVMKSGLLPQMFFIDFRPWKGAILPFINFKINNEDSQGEMFRIAIPRVGKLKTVLTELKELDPADRLLIASMGFIFKYLAESNIQARSPTVLSHELWAQELNEISSILIDQVKS